MSENTNSDQVCEQIAAVLSDEEFLSRILIAIESARGAEATAESQPFEELSSCIRLNRDKRTLSSLEDFVSTHLATQLRFPCPITSEEVIDTMHQQLGGRSVNGESLLRAVEYVVHTVGGGYSDQLNTDNWQYFGEWQPDGTHRPIAVEPTDPYLQQRGFTSFEFAETIKLPDPWMLDSINFGEYGFNLAFSERRNWQNRTYQAEVSIWAYASRKAIEEVERVVFPFLPVILHLVQLAGHTWSYLDSSEARTTIRECFCGLCAERARSTSTIHRRLAIAIRFLSSAKQQDSTAVSMLLTFAAIEALICEKSRDPGVEEQLATWIPTLLEPNGKNREACGRPIRRLYDLRSRIAHGNNLEASSDQLNQAYRLAAGVVTAVCHWISHCRRHQAVGDMFSLDESDDRRFKTLLINMSREQQTISDIPDLSRMLPN